MLIKSRLSWLSGCPQYEDNRWYWLISESGFYMDSKLEVDSQKISVAQRTVNTLFRDYPKALPEVVGDSDIWYQRCCDYIAYAKELIQSKSQNAFSLFERDSKYLERLKYDHRVVPQRQLIVQLSWKLFIDRSDLNKSLSFFLTHKIKNDISGRDLINLIGLHCIDPKRSHTFIDFALKAISHKTICCARYEWFSAYLKPTNFKSIKQRSMIFNPQPFPEIENQKIIQNFLKELSSNNKLFIKRVLSTVDQLPLNEQFKKWVQWWQEAYLLTGKIKNHIQLSVDFNLDSIHALQSQLKLLIEEKPQDLEMSEVLFQAQFFAENKSISTELNSVLETLKSKSVLFYDGISYLGGLYELLRWESYNKALVAEYLSGLNGFLKSVITVEEGFPWTQAPKYYWNSIDYHLLNNCTRLEVKAFFNTLTSIHSEGDFQLKTEELNTIRYLCQAGFDPGQIIKILGHLRKHKTVEIHSKVVAKIAWELNLENSEFIKLNQLYEKFYESDLNDDSITRLFELFKQINALEFFKSLLFELPKSKVFKIDALTGVIVKQSGFECIPPLPKIEQEHEPWISNYPKSLRESIANLTFLNPNSKKLTDSIFKNIWWTRQMLELEIETLKSIVNSQNSENNSSIIKRISKFKDQLQHHSDITADQMDKIKEKLDLKIKHALFARWEKQLQNQFIEDWCSIFNVEPSEIPKWLVEPQLVAKLLPILSFGTSSKNLAIKVIKERIIAPYPFLRRNKNNQLFVKQLNKNGVHWPIEINDYIYEAKNGEQITITVERDPLEIIDMGGHFGTCLSPGDMNYFSVFANIADVNKLVLYARTSKSKVIGRVLLGITDQGGLQIFNRYTHHKDFEFHKHAKLFINNIAKQTGLIITNIGQVTPLCGKDWYDDGPENLTHDIDSFKPGSSFRQQLSDMSASEFDERVRKEIQPKRMNSLIFSLLLSLPEVRKNTQLFESLVHFSLSIPHVANHDLIEFYKIACQYGKGSELYSIHRKQILNHHMKLIKNYWLDYEVLKLLAEHHPSDALKIIKAHAKSQKLDWKDQPVYEAIDSTMVALKKLGRYKLAERIASYK